MISVLKMEVFGCELLWYNAVKDKYNSELSDIGTEKKTLGSKFNRYWVNNDWATLIKVVRNNW
jgi:hypothetical protein